MLIGKKRIDLQVERKTFVRERRSSGGGDSDTWTPDMLLNEWLSYDAQGDVSDIQLIRDRYVQPDNPSTYIHMSEYLITRLSNRSKD